VAAGGGAWRQRRNYLDREPDRRRRRGGREENDVLVAGVAGLVAGFLALLGAIGGKAGGANILRATLRVTFWGALALGITAGIGKLFGTVV